MQIGQDYALVDNDDAGPYPALGIGFAVLLAALCALTVSGALLFGEPLGRQEAPLSSTYSNETIAVVGK